MESIPVVGEFLAWLHGMKVYGSLSLLHCVAGIVAIVAVFSIIRAMKPKQAGTSHTIRVRCLDCNWRGSVSQYKKICTKCQSTNVERVDGPKRP